MELEKLTSTSQGSSRRRYEDACGTAHGLELVGERWALLVLRELMLGPKRFGDIRADLPGISANVLTQRLEGLEASGLLVRRKLPPPSGAQVYELTEWGYEAEPIVQTLGRWAARSPAHDPTLPISAVSIMLSFRTMIDGKRAEGMDAKIGFNFGSEAYVGHVVDGDIEIKRGDPAEGELVFTTTPPLLAAAAYGKQPFDQLEQTGAFKAEGDMQLAARFIDLFHLPPKAGA
jgi:DNA-binding HxlR family transcriptional regulator